MKKQNKKISTPKRPLKRDEMKNIAGGNGGSTGRLGFGGGG